MQKHRMKNLVIACLLLNAFSVFSQASDSLLLSCKNGITKPSILSLHPFGIFVSRVQGNFKTNAIPRTTLKLSIESGNVWGTPIKTYIPNDEEIREQVKEQTWHQAQYFFDEENLDAEFFELQIDGTLKGFRGNVAFNLNPMSSI